MALFAEFPLTVNERQRYMAHGKRSLAQTHWFRVSGFAAITMMLSPTFMAQGDAKDLLIRKLNAQFVPTKFTANNSDIVTAGVVVALKEDGLLMYPATLPMAPVSVPKKGKLTQGFGDMMGVGMVDGMGRPGGISSVPTKKLVTGEKVWVREFELAKDSIMVEVVTDPYDDGRYFGTVKFLIPKGTIPTPEDGVKIVSEVFEAQSAQDQPARYQGDQQTLGPDSGPTMSATGADQQKGIPGEYTGASGSRILLLPDSTFTKFVGGGQGHGQYVADGENLTLTFTSTGFSQHFKTQGGNLLDLNTNQVWARTGDAPAAPMAEIAPPPPPVDAPPPTISLGQTMDQVIAGFGQPLKVANLGGKSIFYYKDMKVIFTSGKVTNVE
jgi:hypothetical protein